MSDKQFGYPKNRSTELARTLFLNNIRNMVDNGCLTGAVFIDLSKAFDTLGHSNLLLKLKAYGIESTPLEWFTNYLFGRFQIVSYDNEISNKYPVNCGVPQGSILGPLLFLVYFNDFQDILQHADGTVIVVSDKSVTEIERKLNKDIENISVSFMKNELVINLKKSNTESMLFGTGKRLSMNHNKLELSLSFNTYKRCRNIQISWYHYRPIIDAWMSLRRELHMYVFQITTTIKDTDLLNTGYS